MYCVACGNMNIWISPHIRGHIRISNMLNTVPMLSTTPIASNEMTLKVGMLNIYIYIYI